jgi:hypothetical protein
MRSTQVTRRIRAPWLPGSYGPAVAVALSAAFGRGDGPAVASAVATPAAAAAAAPSEVHVEDPPTRRIQIQSSQPRSVPSSFLSLRRRPRRGRRRRGPRGPSRGA